MSESPLIVALGVAPGRRRRHLQAPRAAPAKRLQELARARTRSLKTLARSGRERENLLGIAANGRLEINHSEDTLDWPGARAWRGQNQQGGALARASLAALAPLVVAVIRRPSATLTGRGNPIGAINLSRIRSSHRHYRSIANSDPIRSDLMMALAIAHSGATARPPRRTCSVCAAVLAQCLCGWRAFFGLSDAGRVFGSQLGHLALASRLIFGSVASRLARFHGALLRAHDSPNDADNHLRAKHIHCSDVSVPLVWGNLQWAPVEVITSADFRLC